MAWTGTFLHLYIFFCGEGSRSRRCGRTAAMRLIVQPYDEDEDDYLFYCEAVIQSLRVYQYYKYALNRLDF
jgi:hypothetical protein